MVGVGLGVGEGVGVGVGVEVGVAVGVDVGIGVGLCDDADENAPMAKRQENATASAVPRLDPVFPVHQRRDKRRMHSISERGAGRHANPLQPGSICP